jgi:hypothetical protein
MEYLTTEWLIDWANKNCKQKEEIESKKVEALLEARKVLDRLDSVEITVEPIVFDAREFSSSLAFSMALLIASERYKDTDDIIVRYTKPEDKKTHEPSIQFHILKSKAKIFNKYMLECDESFSFALDNSNDIKSCVKLFNSLGVKGSNGERLSSKETDYAKDMKDSFKKGENKILVSVFTVYDDDNGNYVTLEWYVVSNGYECIDFEEVKNKIDTIIKS